MSQPDFLKFRYSHGYDCRKWYNLCVCDSDVIAWAAGSFVAFYDVSKNETTFKRATTGGTVGHIIKNVTDKYPHVAIAEGRFLDQSPIIVVYEWPSMNVAHTLRNGTVNNYSILDYSFDGELLTSIGSHPDYNITIWDWKNDCIRLCTSAHSSDMFNVKFSPYDNNRVVSCGYGHIKFWRTPVTFTGLKLQGTIGRFGATDVSDILGIFIMPDGKVLSGCAWGNILVWEDGLIHIEVSRKGRKPCHNGAITQFIRNDRSNEITSVGMDGHICTWSWSIIDEAMLNYDEPYVELNPITDKYITDTQLISMIRRNDHDWFVQDASGGIWTVNLSARSESTDPQELTHLARKITRSHGGSIVGMFHIPETQFIITCGSDASIMLHSIDRKKSYALITYPESASSFAPLKNNVFIVGFNTGMIKTIKIDLYSIKSAISCIETLRPHKRTITKITADFKLVITTSEDSTMFVHLIDNVKLVPLYYLETPDIVNYISHNLNTVLISGRGGFIFEATLPDVDEPNLDQLTSYKQSYGQSRSIVLNNYELCKLSQIDGDIDSDVVLCSDDSKIGNILWAEYDASQIWFSQENCNCVMRYQFSDCDINAYAIVCGNLGASITSHLNLSDNRCIFGTSDGQLIVTSMNTDVRIVERLAPSEIKDYEKTLKNRTRRHNLKIVSAVKMILPCYFRLPMHDYAATITHIIVTPDCRILATAGTDGNIFTYDLNPIHVKSDDSSQFKPIDMNFKLDDIEELSPEKTETFLTHEEFIRDKERRLSEQIASEQRNKIENELRSLRIEFESLLNLNAELPSDQQIKLNEHDTVNDFIISALDEQLRLVRRRLAHPLEISKIRFDKMMKRNIEPLDFYPFQVNSITQPDVNIKIIRQKKLPETFDDDFNTVKDRLTQVRNARKSLRTPQDSIESIETEEEIIAGIVEPELDTHILDEMPTSPPPPRPLARAIEDYLHRLQVQRSRDVEQQEHMNKNIGGKPEEINIIEQHSKRKNSNGAFKINSMTENQLYTYSTRREIFDVQHEFNEALVALRSDKVGLVQKFRRLSAQLVRISNKLPEEDRKAISAPIPIIDYEVEFIESNLDLKPSPGDDFNDENDSNEAENGSETSDMLLKIDQDRIIAEMNAIVKEWEKSFRCLNKRRERVLLQAQFLKLHLVNLLREQLILEPYESSENGIKNDISIVENKIRDLQDDITLLKRSIETRRVPINAHVDQIKQIDKHFTLLVEDYHQFAPFLKKVFRKKPPSCKINADKESSSSSSSATSSDDDDADINAVRVKKTNLDSNICPPGCDPVIYEKVIQSRDIKYELEGKIKEEEKHIDLIRKQIDGKHAEIKEFLDDLRLNQSKLNELMTEKESKIKDIECVVVLSASQCMSDAVNEMRNDGEALVFPGAGIQDLQDRAKTLLKEADNQRKKLNTYKHHLRRMNADCTYMNDEIDQLKTKIRHILSRKFGISDLKSAYNTERQVSDVLDAVLQNMVQQFRLNTALGISEEMEYQLIEWKRKQYSTERQYCDVLQEHTSKLTTAAALETELFSYNKIKREDAALTDRDDKEYLSDLVRLRRIRNEQRKQIDDLKAEIQRLKLKPYSETLPPITSTNLSTSPSVPISPLSFDLRNSAGSRWIATSLARELNLVETELLGSSSSSNTLMSTIAELFPFLIEGKLDVNEAAEKIIEGYHSKSNSADFRNSKSYKRSQQSIAEILSQITKQNLKLGDRDVVDIGDITDHRAEVQYIVQELLETGVSYNDSGAVDIAVMALIEIAPQLIKQKFSVDDIVDSLKDKVKANTATIKAMTIAVVDCISAQDTTPMETSSIAAECLEKLQRSLEDLNQSKNK